jgi:hypothetical protein
MLRRRTLGSKEEETSEWLYEAYLTDTGEWYGKRCPAIVFDVKQGERYYIEWSNVRTVDKYIYDMCRCGGAYLLYTPNRLAESGSIEIVIPSDGILYVGVGRNANVAHGGFVAACFDGDYIKIKKAR